MARMIPTVIDKAAPNSERRVFDNLRSAPDSDNWIVLHSLGLSNAYTGEYGEVDFVVIIPQFGIVCVEVKGGGVSQRQGLWFTVNAEGEQFQLKRSPIRQVQEAMWKLRSAILKHFGKNSVEAQCPIGWSVVFPDVLCPPLTTEFVRTEIIDRKDLALNLRESILATPSITNLATKSGSLPPTTHTSAKLLSFLRPDFDRVVAPAVEVKISESAILSLTEEQYASLDAIADNPICLVKGSAGTGKTLLAIEQARRFASTGMDVLLTCFNKNLSVWLAEVTSGFGPGRVEVGSIHGLLRKRILSSSRSGEFLQEERTSADEFYRETYFLLGSEAIGELGERFDAIIVDEVQDISHDGLAMVVGQWVSGRPKHRVLLLGDFERQALYDSGEQGLLRFQEIFKNVPTFKLRLNCRNTKRIAQQTRMLSGFTDCIVSPKQIEGAPVELIFLDCREAAHHKLELVLNLLGSAGFTPSDIVILGRLRFENSWLAGVSVIGRWRIAPLGQSSTDKIAYSTIHGFKGLERAAVILIEPTQKIPQEIDALLYVGMSRARLRLFMLCDKDTKTVLESHMATHIRSELENTP